MPQMTPQQARVIDPVLTNIARGYKQPDLVAEALFPVVPVPARGGQVIEFGREDFVLRNTRRAPGAATERVQYGYLGKHFALEQYSLEGQVPFELLQDANRVPGVDLARVAVAKTMASILLSAEHQAAQLARDPAQYPATHVLTLAGTARWVDPASDPSADIENAKEVVRAAIGRRPNVALVSARAFRALKTHPKILDRIKFTGRDAVTEDILATLWGLARVVVGDAVVADAQGNTQDVWGGDVILAYTELGSLADMGLPSFGYTYRLRGYPIVERPYQDRRAKSWIYPVTDERAPVIAGADAGFLIQNAA